MKKRIKTGGRVKNSLNKIPRELRTSITDFLNDKFEDVINEFDKLEGKDKLNFYKDLLPYAVPKLNAAMIKTDNEQNQQFVGDVFARIRENNGLDLID